MTHIHLPDGFLPLWLWLGGYLLTGFILALIFQFRRREQETRRFALLGIFAALMLLVMSIEIPGIPYHVNLSVVASIVLGPPLAILAAFIVNLMLAFAGHGGITVVGINTLAMAVEILAGYGAFILLRRMRMPLFGAGLLAVVLGLAFGTAASFGIIALGKPSIDRQLQVSQQRESLHLGKPAPHLHEEEPIGKAAQAGKLNLTRLAVLMLGLGVIGWVLEGLLSAAILTMLQRTFPALLPGPKHVGVEEMAE